jgi:hypothetical protein
MQEFLETAALPFNDLMLCVLASSLVFWVVELEKWVVRRRAV